METKQELEARLRPQRIVTLTPEMIEQGWHTERCANCQRVYARLCWHTPSGCEYCHYSFVE